MSSRYLLPCDCGRNVAIELSQAGQSVSCPCGRQLQVPTMRLIRQLPSDEAAPAKSATKAQWNPTKGATFALGVLLLICGIVITIYTYPAQSQLSAFKPSQELFQESQNNVDTNTPEELLDLWHTIVEHGIGEHESSPFVFAHKEANRLWVILVTGIALASCGVVLTAASLILPVVKTSPR